MPKRTPWPRSATGGLLAGGALLVAALLLAGNLDNALGQTDKDKPPGKDAPAKDAPSKDAPPKDAPPKDAPPPDKKPEVPFKVDTEILNKPIKRDDLQRKMAEESSDPIFKVTRLDRVYFAYREEMGAMLLELRFEGVCLAPDYNDPMKQDMLLRQKLSDLFYQVYPDLKTRFDKRDKKDQPSISIGGIQPVKVAELPFRRLQQMVIEAKDLDGTLFSGASYDGEGRLVLEGLVATDSQRANAEKLVEKVAMEKPLWLRADAGKPGKPYVLNMPAWSPIALLQKELADGADLEPAVKDLCNQTLIRRVYFAYEGDPVDLNLWVEAVCLAPNFNKEKDGETIRGVMARATKSSWEALKARHKFRFDLNAAVKSGKIKAVPSPVYRLQQMTNRYPELDGTLLERAVFDKDGVMRIQGFINHKDHIKRIEDFIRELELSNPEWLKVTEAGSGPRWITRLGVFSAPLRPAAFQGALSNSKERLHRQTRLDRVHFDYEGVDLVLRFYGANLYPEWPNGAALLLTFLNDQLKANWLRETDPRTKPALKVGEVKEVTEDPVPRLQQRAGLNSLIDGMLFLPAEYAADATLRFPVLVVKPAHEEHARAMIESIRRDHPCFRPDRSEKPWKLETTANLPPLQSNLQIRLAESTGYKELRQVRVDRAWFGYIDLDIRKLEVRCQGISIGAGVAPMPGKEPRPRPEIAEKVAKEASLMYMGHKMTPNLDAVEVLPQPGPDLQSRVARRETLDGIRLYRSDEARKYEGEFDREGKLVLRGQWQTPRQEKELRELLTQYFAVRPPRLDSNGLVLNMGVFRNDRVLLDLRRFAADRMEDVLLQRLYFDDKGQVKLQGFVANEKDIEELKKFLDERLKSQPISNANPLGGKGVLVVSRNASLLMGLLQDAPEKPVIDLVKRDGLTAHLRSLLQGSSNLKDAPPPERWDGVLITRGHYDPEGNYILSGLVAEERQRQLLEVLLQELSPTKWRTHLPNGWSLEGVQRLPILPLMSRLRVVLPAYAEFDGLSLQRVFHDIEGRLVLRFSLIGRLDKQAEANLKKLIDAHPEWKARSGGVRIQIAGKGEERDPRIVEESLLKAAQHLKYERIEPAIEHATTAILHDPEDSTGWYLRALGHLIRGETEEADRDLRRTAQLEREGVRYPGPRANLRLERLELLQGKQREILNERKLRVLNEIEAGKPPIVLPRTP